MCSDQPSQAFMNHRCGMCPPRCVLDRSVHQPTRWTVANAAHLLSAAHFLSKHQSPSHLVVWRVPFKIVTHFWGHFTSSGALVWGTWGQFLQRTLNWTLTWWSPPFYFLLWWRAALCYGSSLVTMLSEDPIRNYQNMTKGTCFVLSGKSMCVHRNKKKRKNVLRRTNGLQFIFG